ncbi:MAG: ABC transporter ATP-binding protein [Clostridiales bacterium]|nr:ABC transporter ATP-binding protein [Clostridiales bacterium]
MVFSLSDNTNNVTIDSRYIIQCDNLVKIYKTKDSEVLALQGLDMTIEPGELMAIVGKSGSGKSTFLNMIGGLDRPSAGRLFVDGKDLFKMTGKSLIEYKKRTVGFVWQNNARNLFPYLNSIQNIQVPMIFTSEKKKRERAQQLLELVGMAHKKYNRLGELSGGEQQRIAIAIALANNPKILLADEPTGSVDKKTADYILDVFRELNNTLKTTIIIVTHDMNLAKKVNRVVSIQDGKISSEMHAKGDYKKRMAELSTFEDIHDEFTILDRAGRLQIPRELLDRMGVHDNKVRLEYVNDTIVIKPARDKEAI